jgi:REP element-mobilizing transposase RayT
VCTLQAVFAGWRIRHAVCVCVSPSTQEVRQEWHFVLIEWAPMPDHFHLLLKPEPARTIPLIL